MWFRQAIINGLQGFRLRRGKSERMSVETVMTTYDLWSETYDQTDNPLIPIEEMAVRSLLRTIEFQDALDAATGTGRHALYLAEQGKCVSAVDGNQKMLAKAQDKARQRRLTIDFRREDVGELSFADGSFDLVICALALAHVEDLAKPCREFMRILRGGGHLIITDLHPSVQEEMGTDRRWKVIEKQRAVFFPNYHARVEDYRQATEAVGAQVVALLDIPMKLGRELFPGALLVWARKPEKGT
jgi:ubiquinone/menaquinone biosynthesis C-methylase UbiE